MIRLQWQCLIETEQQNKLKQKPDIAPMRTQTTPRFTCVAQLQRWAPLGIKLCCGS